VKDDEMGGHVERMTPTTDTYEVYVDKPDRKTPPGRPRHRRDDNTKIVVKELGWKDVDRVNTNHDGGQGRALAVNPALNSLCSVKIHLVRHCITVNFLVGFFELTTRDENS
jgi:hypothetical protein